jgi:hypothetical protein
MSQGSKHPTKKKQKCIPPFFAPFVWCCRKTLLTHCISVPPCRRRKSWSWKFLWVLRRSNDQIVTLAERRRERYSHEKSW